MYMYEPKQQQQQHQQNRGSRTHSSSLGHVWAAALGSLPRPTRERLEIDRRGKRDNMIASMIVACVVRSMRCTTSCSCMSGTEPCQCQLRGKAEDWTAIKMSLCVHTCMPARFCFGH